MKTLLPLALLSAVPPALLAAGSWQEITVPTVAQAAASFAEPPAEFRAIHWAIWGGQQTKERVLADLDRIQASGAGVYMINNSRGLQPKYFSPEYLDLVKFTVAECKKRGLKVWIEDDGGYPSGFAGGLISQDHPELAMQALVADARYTVAAGQTLTIPVPPDTLGILAFNRSARETRVLPVPAKGQFSYTAPNPGLSEVLFVRHVFRSSPTRYTNRADGTADKDSLYALIDYLNPEATRVYLQLIHGTYEKVVGEEFGKTILGFRGDEPDYTGFMPWSPLLLATFQRLKGYDLAPYLARFFAPELDEETVRAKADYWDVWSAMFRDNYFKPISDWCQARGMGNMEHLNHEEVMIDLARGEDLIRNEGDFFRAMRYVDVPGIDNLSQIRPGTVADFPKLASSAAHLYGRPQVWTEAGGGLAQSGKFIADYQLVRGINFLNIRGMNVTAGGDPAPLLDPSAAIAGYVSRASYLLTIGRPAAQVALFHPTDSMWLGDKEADDVTVRLTTELMEHQVDFDYIDHDSLAGIARLEGGTFTNLSGQAYRAVIIPTSTAIQQAALERLRQFARAGGKVIFVGRPPSLVVGRSFLHPEPGQPDLGFAVLEPEPAITPRVLAALPKPDLQLDAPCAPVKYIHRTLQDGEVYFLFNESAETQTRTVTLAGHGPVQVWDATRGTVHPVAGVGAATGSVAVPLQLAPYESRFIVLGAVPATAAAPVPAVPAAATLADLGGNWTITLGDKTVTGPLKSWEALEVPAFTGTALYRREFAAPARLPAGQRAYLSLGDVQEIARVRLNGTALAATPWPPYVWDVTSALKAGANNTLEIEVQVPTANVRRTGGGGGAGGARGGRRGGAPATATAETARGLSPTGVPGGLSYEQPARGGARGGAAGGRGGAENAASNPEPASGLLGPVKLLAQ